MIHHAGRKKEMALWWLWGWMFWLPPRYGRWRIGSDNFASQRTTNDHSHYRLSLIRSWCKLFLTCRNRGNLHTRWMDIFASHPKDELCILFVTHY